MIVQDETSVRTVGFGSILGRELVIPIADSSLGELAGTLCADLAEYCKATGTGFALGDKIGWATSVIRLVDGPGGSTFVAQALDIESDEFRAPMDELLIAWGRQRETCVANGSPFVQTQLDSMVVASPDIIAGGPVRDAVRYPFLAPNSGWWIFGEGYSGNLDEMRVVHMLHPLLADQRMRPFLGLAPGYCFELATSRVWFEGDVAAQDPI